MNLKDKVILITGASRSDYFRSLLRKYFTRDVKFKVVNPKPLDDIRRGMLKTGKYSRKFINSVVAGLSRSSAYDN